MNTDFFGKEERKQMLERIERIELANRATTTSIASINEKLAAISDMIAGKSEAAEKPSFEGVTAMPMPSYREMQEKRDADFNKIWAEDREYTDAKFEEEMGVLREIRSGIAETNSLLAAILKKMEEPKPTTINPQWPPMPQYINCGQKGTTGGPLPDVSCNANPYIPEPTYKGDASDCDTSHHEHKPL